MSASSLRLAIARLTEGYELCSTCIQTVGVNHAVEAGSDVASSSIGWSSSPEDAQRQRRRAAPKRKGSVRHAYREMLWGYYGWEDVVQVESLTSKCSTCEAVTHSERYKCASCQDFNLCKACYSQVHDLHPIHVFLRVPDTPDSSNSDTLVDLGDDQDIADDESALKHPGVKCFHCMLDIVGARFHCAICDSVDICSNCESAGLPGNLDSSDGGHDSSHILIKIPYPLDTARLRVASRRALHMWTRDAANLGQPISLSKANSVVSSYTRTVIGSSSRRTNSIEAMEHHINCDGCGEPIVGARYQCANCPSSPTAYNLCENCEPKSYLIHDYSHVFFLLPRPVHRSLESPYPLIPKLYKEGAGSPPGIGDPENPREYLKKLVHTSAVCDRCIKPIQGEWFRCAYCSKDLCDVCHEVDTHNDSHVFLVFKAASNDRSHALARYYADIENPTPVIPYPLYR
ncbi:hypothetical protein FISHEDRAFT_40294 [Fistulina hepatica ATCC 64428]|uniref:ZZ-type domain-containing protein n=1 Tax=Fistulina hepatica ATCC 64428 TaxID=1128425 RepID=A0A0D7AGF3_9AGAR|nr:hypothetical protein FISHEDRAFT_40294 [Fistulina hepatica ATCC 64428]